MKYATVIDSGLWVELACRLARDGVDTNYYSSWESAFVSVRDPSPGFGLEDEGVKRIDDPFAEHVNARGLPVLEDAIYLFPWLNQEYIAEEATRRELKVFGAVNLSATRLERDRELMRKILLGVRPMQPLAFSMEIKGLSELGDFIDDVDGESERYIKLSNFRGDFETYHHTDRQNTKMKMAEWRKRFGPYSDRLTFYLEEPIEAEVEVGVDTFFAGGRFLAPGVIGYEVKDKLYVGRVTDILPPMIHDATFALSDYLKSVEYANWLTNEMRITKDGTAYLTDITTRCPIPPGAAMLEAIDNLSEIIENGANGSPTEIQWNSQYLCEVIVSSPVLKEDWLEVRFDPDMRQWIKMRNFSKVDGRYWIAPHPTGMTEMISCVGLGDTLLDAKDQARHMAEEVCEKTYQATFDARAFDEVEDTIEKGVKLGIEF